LNRENIRHRRERGEPEALKTFHKQSFESITLEQRPLSTGNLGDQWCFFHKRNINPLQKQFLNHEDWEVVGGCCFVDVFWGGRAVWGAIFIQFLWLFLDSFCLLFLLVLFFGFELGFDMFLISF